MKLEIDQRSQKQMLETDDSQKQIIEIDHGAEKVQEVETFLTNKDQRESFSHMLSFV